MGEVGYKKPPKHTQWKKGQSGNPKGKQRLHKLTDILTKILGSDKDSDSPAHKIVDMMLQKAYDGDMKAAEVLLAYAYGKPKQSTDITTGGEPIKGFHSIKDAFWDDVRDDKP